MKRLLVLIPILLLMVLALAGCGQSAEKLNNEGNEAFVNQEYEAALTAYHKAEEDAPEMAEPHYNAANTHYRLEDYEQAQNEIEQALVNEENQQDLDQNSFYNLGNTFFQAQHYEAAIEAFKEALRLNPDDLQAKQNLELALRQLQQQQQEQQQQQDQDNQDQQDQQQQQGQEDQNQQDEQQDDEQDDQQADGQQDGQQQDGQADGQRQQIVGLTKEQAKQLLEAAAEGTESLEEYLQQIFVFPGSPPMEDW